MKIIDILNAPWAIEPAKLDELQGIYRTHMRGEKIDLKAVEAQLGRPLGNEEQGYEIVDGVAILAVDGVLSKRMNLFSRISGGTSIELLARDFRGALADPAVHAILLHADSPGGAIDGVHELAREIFAARDVKSIVALADSNMASAAYWLGAAAQSVYIAGETTFTGSLGIVMKHVDMSKAEEQAGLKTTEVYAGKYKRIASEYSPLTKEGKDVLQALVDKVYSVMVDDIAEFRGTDAETVVKDMAEGRVFVGREAIDAGLVDGVATLPVLIESLKSGVKPAQFPRRIRAAGGAAAAEAAATASATPPGAGAAPSIESNPKGKDMITRESLDASNPDLVAAILAEGRKVGLDAGRIEGAAAERSRIQDVEAQALPGHEDLIKALKFDGKTTGEQAAVAVLQAEKAKNKATLGDLTTDAPKPAPHAAAPAPKPAEPKGGEQDSTPEAIAERCKAAWEKDPKVREQHIDLASYTAYEKAAAQGKVRIIGQKAA